MGLAFLWEINWIYGRYSAHMYMSPGGSAQIYEGYELSHSEQ